jgi:hypothetical protein
MAFLQIESTLSVKMAANAQAFYPYWQGGEDIVV